MNDIYLDPQAQLIYEIESKKERQSQTERQQLEAKAEEQPKETHPPELLKQLQNKANNTLKAARSHGLIAISQSRFGLLHLYYYPNRSYQLVQCGRSPTTIVEGKTILPVLVDAFVVEEMG